MISDGFCDKIGSWIAPKLRAASRDIRADKACSVALSPGYDRLTKQCGPYTLLPAHHFYPGVDRTIFSIMHSFIGFHKAKFVTQLDTAWHFLNHCPGRMAELPVLICID